MRTSGRIKTEEQSQSKRESTVTFEKACQLHLGHNWVKTTESSSSSLKLDVKSKPADLFFWLARRRFLSIWERHYERSIAF